MIRTALSGLAQATDPARNSLQAAFAQDIEEVHPVSRTPHRLLLEAFSVDGMAVPFRLEPKADQNG